MFKFLDDFKTADWLCSDSRADLDFVEDRVES